MLVEYFMIDCMQTVSSQCW